MAGDEDIFAQFLMISGTSPEALRNGLKDRIFLAGVLEFLLSRENLLIEFCRSERIDPHFPHLAHTVLAGSDKDMNFI
jgi:hypothetical protein